jgi:hypothetical protein
MCEKVAYLTKCEAYRAMTYLRTSQTTKRYIQGYYLCNKCGHYHLTSLTRRKYHALMLALRERLSRTSKAHQLG